ncbi:COG4223 family protein [Rhizobium sp. 18055]|uniref:COG4223 family protein n=1 Tax=Rhizobium sp. 18055 TaxID=2681403 RepID=UPI001358B763|nr:mitofilin family membrane protein [Rhizobium sp. 18055]
MAPGNPPRHSKSTDAPVTIDLDAQEIASERDAPKDVPPAAEPEPVTAEATPEPPEPVIEEQPVFAEDKASEAEQPPYSHAPEPVDPVVEQPRQQANTSGLIAAGIVGGLIALLGAGAIQYAGFLPGPSAPQTASPEIANLSSEIDGLKQSVANLAAAPPNAAPIDDTLAKRISALEIAAKAPQAASTGADSATVDALNQKISSLTGELDQLRGAVTQATDQRASSGAEIEQRLTEAEKKLNEPRQDVAVAKAIAAAALKAAIDRGGPFVAELDTFAGVSPDDPVATDLRSFAETGVPSRAELIRQVPDVATSIIDSVNKTDPNQSWSDRLMVSAKSLVKVRPVGNIEGDSVEAIAARMEDKVKNGDLPGAATEWNTLPADAKQASAAFKQSLEARIRVEELVGSALSKAVSGTGTGKEG